MNTSSASGGWSGTLCRCSGCGRSYQASDWRALRVHDVLSPEQLGTLVTRWPEGACVEVRVCHCGTPIAHIRRSP
jgi:hypothetical protein